MSDFLLLAAAAVPDQEVEHLALGVLGPSALEGYRGQYLVAAAVVGEPPQERAVEYDLINEAVEVYTALFHRRPLKYIASRLA
jgi:hypothetical protein